MSHLTLEQIRGVKDLIHDAVAAGVDVAEKTHVAIARQPYAILKQVGIIAAPVGLIEHVQMGITSGVYQSIRAVNWLVATVATGAIDMLEQR